MGKLNELCEAMEWLGKQETLPQVLDVAAEAARQLGRVEASAVVLPQDGYATIDPQMGHRGLEPGFVERWRLSLSEGAGAQAMREARPLVAEEPEPLLEQYGIRGWALFPLLVRRVPVGILCLFHKVGLELEEEVKDALFILSWQTALAIEGARLSQEVHRRKWEAWALNELAGSIFPLESEEVVGPAIAGLCRLMGCELVALLLVEAPQATLTFCLRQPEVRIDSQAVQARLLEAHNALSAHKLTPQQITVAWWGDKPEGTDGEREIPSFLTSSLIREERLLGLVSAASSGPQAFDASHRRFLSLAADQLALALENMRLFQETREMAYTDGLTGVYNYRYLWEALRREVALALRHNYSLSLLILDTDGLRAVNNTYGHLAGDMLLQGLANLLGATVRGTDMVARPGGDEFAILMPHTNEKGLASVAERIYRQVEEHRFDIGETSISLSVSIGLGSLSELEVGSAENLVRQADQALYEVKRAKGRSEPHQGVLAARVLGR